MAGNYFLEFSMFWWNNGKFVISKIFNLRMLAGGFVCCVWETSFILQTTNKNIHPHPSLCTQQTNRHQLRRRLQVLGNSVFCCMFSLVLMYILFFLKWNEPRMKMIFYTGIQKNSNYLINILHCTLMMTEMQHCNSIGIVYFF